MPTLYLTEQRSMVKLEGETIVVSIPADEVTERGRQTVQIPLIKVDEVVVHGNVTLTAPALQALLERGVGVSFCGPYGQFHGRLDPPESKNGQLRVAQHRAYNDLEMRLRLARAFVSGKLHNQRTLLLRSNRKRNEAEVEKAADGIQDMLLKIVTVQVGDGTAGKKALFDQLMGFEGQGASVYFQAFPALLQTTFDFPKRVRRPPTDPVNAMLSYGYTLLMHQFLSAIQVVGLDPYVGFLHEGRYARPSLALDLMEEFRPIIVDSVVIRAINMNILTETHFSKTLEAVSMTPAGRKLFLQQWEQRLETEIEHPVFKTKVKYRRCLELQTRLLAKALTGDIPEYVPFKAR